jgi:hypothetical protein
MKKRETRRSEVSEIFTTGGFQIKWDSCFAANLPGSKNPTDLKPAFSFFEVCLNSLVSMSIDYR